MIEAKSITALKFAPFTLADKAFYEDYLSKERERGCEFSFANLFLWGEQSFTVYENHIVIFSKFGKRCVYLYPLGDGDKKPVIDAIIKDAKERGIQCRIIGVTEEGQGILERLYPSKFLFKKDEGSFDYVYGIDELAELAGRSYHGKRNHLARFKERFPDYRAEPISDDNVSSVREMAREWYKERTAENPDSDFTLESLALDKALSHYRAIGMEGLVILSDGEVLAFTLGNRMRDDTFDVNFEKARSDVQGAYTAINYEFARYIRDKYPSVRYIDREEDMGIEGLRRAKRSYHPHHMIEKRKAYLVEDGYDY